MLNKKSFSYSWVLVDELMVGSAPIHKDNLIELKKEGVKSVLSLCSAEEVKLPYEISEFFVCQRFVLPDHTYNTNPKTEEMLEVLSILDVLIKNGPVYVHCFAGVERSPLVCMAYLIKYRRYSVQIALDYLMSIHPKTNPLDQQIQLLYKI